MEKSNTITAHENLLKKAGGWAVSTHFDKGKIAGKPKFRFLFHKEKMN